MEFIALLLLVSTLSLSNCSPVVATENPFVANVTACRRLPTSSVCSKWIDYEVPASIVSLANVIDYNINGTVMERTNIPLPNSDCSNFEEALCRFRYPRCQGSNVVMRSLQDCQQKIRNCGPQAITEAEGICNLNATVPLDSCAAISSYPAWNGFRRCNLLGSNIRVTAWMMEYLNLTDFELSQKLNAETGLSSLHNPASCVQNTTLYSCRFYGQCTDNGTIQKTNYYERCESFVSW